MTVTIPVGIAIIVIGLMVKFFFDVSGDPNINVSWPEFFVVLGAFLLLTATIVGPIGKKMSVDAQLSFNEYRNSSLEGYRVITVKCTRDGPCQWEYNCDPYQCNPHDCNCRCTSRDENGNCTSETCDTCYDTCYHDCPYCTEEYHYELLSGLGSFRLADYVLPANPNANRWRNHVSVPGWVIDRAGTQPPQLWTYYKARLDEGIADPVTKVYTYQNFLQASDITILNERSGDIATYQEQGLLPRFPSGTFQHFRATKVGFVGFTPTDPAAWHDAVERFNSVFGPELKGDLHVVVVQNDTIASDPLSYLIALKAHWQDKKVYGDNTLAKNAVLVIVGTTDGETLDWARAVTGMPVGNETLVNEIGRRVNGVETPFTPEAVIGNLRVTLTGNPNGGHTQRIVTRSHGYLEDIIWGVSQPSTRFIRVSMDEFEYQKDSIRPTAKAKRLMVIVGVLLSAFGWFAALKFDIGYKTRYR